MTDYDKLIKTLRGECEYALPSQTRKALLQAADAIEDLDDIAQHQADALRNVPRWISVEERLPETGGHYIVYLRPFEGQTDTGFTLGDLAYPTEMYFDKGQMLWISENESYNAVLSAVNTETVYHVTHWMPLPEPPKEES